MSLETFIRSAFLGIIIVGVLAAFFNPFGNAIERRRKRLIAEKVEADALARDRSLAAIELRIAASTSEQELTDREPLTGDDRILRVVNEGVVLRGLRSRAYDRLLEFNGRSLSESPPIL